MQKLNEQASAHDSSVHAQIKGLDKELQDEENLGSMCPLIHALKDHGVRSNKNLPEDAENFRRTNFQQFIKELQDLNARYA